MTEIIIGLSLMIAGTFMIAMEIRACEYERNNIGGWLFLIGALIVVGKLVELAWGYFA